MPMNQHSGISGQRVAGLPPLLKLHLPLRIASSTAPAVYTDLVVSLNFDIMASSGKEESITLGRSRPPGFPFQQGAFGALTPFR